MVTATGKNDTNWGTLYVRVSTVKYGHIPWAISARSLSIHGIMSAYDGVAYVTAGRVGDRVFYLAPATKHTSQHPVDAYRACMWWPATSLRAVIFVYAS